jgi:hypothetical protein
MTRTLLPFALAACAFVMPCVAEAQESVRITVPAGVSFNVTNVAANTAANPARVDFDTAILLPLHRLRISVRADAANFASPSPAGTLIPAGKASWTTSNATGALAAAGP